VTQVPDLLDLLSCLSVGKHMLFTYSTCMFDFV
jgi:hypothetical protein